MAFSLFFRFLLISFVLVHVSGKFLKEKIDDVEEESRLKEKETNDIAENNKKPEAAGENKVSEDTKKTKEVKEAKDKATEDDDDEIKKALKAAEAVNERCGGDNVVSDGILCVNWSPESIQRRKERKKGLEMEEGDLAIAESVHRRRRVAVNKRWPRSPDGNIYIPYEFETTISNITNAFMQGVEEYNKLSCIRFVPRRGERNYIAVINDVGCYTYLGMFGGRQPLSLQAFTFCGHKGVAIHELMHVLGFMHTMARRDRNSFITVHFNNIPFNLQRQFRIHNEGEAFVFGVPYDKQSVMHYGRRAGAFRGTVSITSNTNFNEELGQRLGFSPKDITQVNRMYCPHLVPNKP